MKKNIFKVGALAVSVALAGVAQAGEFPQSGQWSAGVGVNQFYMGGSDQPGLSAGNIEDFTEVTARGEKYHSKTQSTLIEVGYGRPDIEGWNADLHSLRASIGNRIFLNNAGFSGFRPLAGYGAGLHHYDSSEFGSDTEAFGYLEVGLQKAVGKNLIVDGGYRGRVEIENGHTDGQAFVGVSWLFGDAPAPAIAKPSMPEPEPTPEPEPEPQVKVVAAEPEPEIISKAVISVDDKAVSFALGSAEVKTDAVMPALAPFADAANDNPDLRIKIDGFTDATGPADFNQTLSQDRADAIAGVLVDRLGVAPGKIETAGHGEAGPVASNDTPDGRAKNRRVEITLIK